MYTLEYIPDELALKILDHLSPQDLRKCRLLSFTMRQNIDRLFSLNFECIHLNDYNLHEFRISRRDSIKEFVVRKSSKVNLISNFTRMKIGQVLQFIETPGKSELNPNMIRSVYFENITVLEFTHAIGRKYFHRILELTESLQILKLNSAALGGSPDLFGLRSRSKSCKSDKLETLLNYWPFLKERFFNKFKDPNSCYVRPLINILELHIKLDYISPSTPNFSPFVLVENLNSIRELPVFFLRSYNVLIEESEDAELFYFTITSLLGTIPVRAYECLKFLSFVTPKCRQENGGGHFENPWRKKEKIVKSMTKFSEMKLKEFQFKIESGYRHGMPGELVGLLSSQKYLDRIDLTGIA